MSDVLAKLNKIAASKNLTSKIAALAFRLYCFTNNPTDEPRETLPQFSLRNKNNEVLREGRLYPLNERNAAIEVLLTFDPSLKQKVSTL